MIESTRNPRVVRATRLHRARHRRQAGQTLLEGPNLIEAALQAGVVPEIVFTLGDDPLVDAAAERGSAVATVSGPVMKKLAGTDNPRGPVAVVAVPPPAELVAVDTVVLCGISDPGNAGTLIRSAAAFSFQVVATVDTVDLWSPKVLRAAAGAHFVTGIVSDASVADVAAVGIVLVALLPADDGRTEPGEDDRPIGLLVGNEAHGLSREQTAAATASLTVPTSGAVESLNAAVAGSIAMFAIAQGRQ